MSAIANKTIKLEAGRQAYCSKGHFAGACLTVQNVTKGFFGSKNLHFNSSLSYRNSDGSYSGLYAGKSCSSNNWHPCLKDGESVPAGSIVIPIAGGADYDPIVADEEISCGSKGFRNWAVVKVA